jgi:hypothetical protein
MSTTFKALCAIAMVFGMMNIASAHYDVHCAGPADPYSKFGNPCATCQCPGYPEVRFHNSSV